MNRFCFLAILAIVSVCVSTVTEACDKCRSSYVEGYAYSSSSGYSYAYVSRPVYTIRYCFSDCEDVCYVPAPKPKCEIKEIGLQRFDTNWCKCGCHREYVDQLGQVWKTDAQVKTLGAELFGWRYDVIDRDDNATHFVREAKLVDGEWKATGRLWHYVRTKALD